MNTIDAIERGNQMNRIKLMLKTLNTYQVMAADEQGNYTKEVTPKIILEAIAARDAALEVQADFLRIVCAEIEQREQT